MKPSKAYCDVQTGPHAAEQQSAPPAQAFSGIPGVADDAPVGSACTADLQVDHNTMCLPVPAFSVLHLLYCLVGNCNPVCASLMISYSCIIAQATECIMQATCMQYALVIPARSWCLNQVLDYFVRDHLHTLIRSHVCFDNSCLLRLVVGAS